MSPDGYIKESPFLSGMNEEYLKEFGDSALVQEYMKKMERGDKFHIPFIDYSDNSQEGNHRVIAAKKLGVEEIPVLVVKKFVKNPFPDPEEMGKLRQEYGSPLKGKFKNPKRVIPFSRNRT